MSLIKTGAELETPEDVYARLNTALTGATLPDAATIPEDVTGVNESLDYATKALKSSEASLEKVSKANEALLSGKVPDDVFNEMKRRSAEESVMQGFGVGGMTKDKLLRGLGQSSLGLIQAGMQTQQQLAEQQRGISEGYRGISGVRETVRQFNSSYAQNAQQLLDASRKTNLAATGMGLEYAQFRANLTNEVNQQIVSLTGLREELLYKYSASDKRGEFADTQATLDRVISQLESILGA